MKLIVGLGNPGQEYEKTRHNAGFLALDYIAAYYGTSIDKKKFKSLYIKTNFCSGNVVLIKPQTYMNLSGTAVSNFSKFFNVSVDNIIVLHDDIDLDFGSVRVKAGGGHGGHNGIRDIVNKLNSKDFIRIKIGVGRPDNPNYPVDKYVLSKFSKQQEREIQSVFDYTLNVTEKILTDSVTGAMNEFNRKYS